MLEFAAMNEFQRIWLLVYFYEAILFLILYRNVLSEKSGRKIWRNILLGLCIAGYVAAKWKWESYILPNILVMIVYGVLVLFLLSDAMHCNYLWMAEVFAVCIELGRILVYGSIYITGNAAIYDEHTWLLRILAQILKLVLVLLSRKIVCDYSRFRVRVMDYLLILIAIIQLIFMHYRRRISVNNSADLAFEVQTFLILGLGVLVLLTAMLYHIKSFLKEEQLRKIQEAVEKDYQKIQTRSEVDAEIRRVYHDLKHQLAAIDFSGIQDDKMERKKLADKLLEHVAELNDFLESGNPLLNSILNHKIAAAREKKIKLELFFEQLDYDFIDPMDLCSIVGNALDNAIEAVEKLPEQKDRWVHVKAAMIQGIWVLKVENTCMLKPVLRNGKYKSSKGDRDGIGISSIRYCAEKYEGKVEIKAEDGVFALRVMIPVSGKPVFP